MDRTETIKGRVVSVRHHKKDSFIQFNSLSTTQKDLYLVVSRDVYPEKDKITVQSVFYATCTIHEAPPKMVAKGTPFEYHLVKLTYLSVADSEYNSRVPDSSSTTIRKSERALWLRSDIGQSLSMLMHHTLQGLRLVFHHENMVEIVPPSFGKTQCEGGSSLFSFDHLGTPAYLTQSSQFALEYMVPVVGSCYCIWPSFRAERSHTRRHLTSYTHAELELADVPDLDYFLAFLQQLVKAIISSVTILAGSELRSLDKFERVEEFLTKDIIVLHHAKAIELLNEWGILKSDGKPFTPRDDIPEAQERQMVDKLDSIVLLHSFPHEFKSFYMKPCPDEPDRVCGVDVLFPGVGEVIGSGLRVTTAEGLRQGLKLQAYKDAFEKLESLAHTDEVEVIRKAIQHKRDDVESLLLAAIEKLPEAQRFTISLLPEEDYADYIDLRRYGYIPTAGLGLGVERLVCWLSGEFTVKDVTPFPRYDGCLSP